jgi:hypothetical protein
MATKPLTESAADTELRAALTAFETSLATPLVSGELAKWTETVKSAWEPTSQQVQHHAECDHPSQYEEIGGADPELLPRVEQLQSEDRAIEQDRHSLDQLVTRIASHLPKLEPDEEKAQQHVKKLVDEGIAFITRVRKHEVAIQTWFVEAFNRDRGTSG